MVHRELAIKANQKQTSTATRLRGLAAARQKSRAPQASVDHEYQDEQGITLLPPPPPSARVVRSALDFARGLGIVKRHKGDGVALFSAEGKALYDRVQKEVREYDRIMGCSRIGDGERFEIIKRLTRMNGGQINLIANHSNTKTVTGVIQKFASGEQRILRGFASTDAVDRVGDVVVPSGMQASLPVSMLWNHNANYPIGSVTKAEIRSGGVWIESSLVTGTQQAEDAWILVSQQAVTSFSIGFIPLKSEPIANGGRRFTAWELTEISIVAVPANTNAKIRRSM